MHGERAEHRSCTLAHKQSLENLELNKRILDLLRQQEIMVETTIGKEVQKATDRIKTTMETITKDCLAKIDNQYGQVLEQVTPYDTEDARQVLQKQHDLLDMLEHSNAALVSENSKLRIHHSFMPTRYREEVEEMQKTDNSLYRSQRRTPRIISPQDSNHGGVLKFVEAPRAHEMARRYLHDCEHGGIAGIRQGMREVAKLKANLRKNRIPYKQSYVGNIPPLLPDDPPDDPPQRDPPQGDPPRGKGKSSLRPSYLHAAQGAATRRREMDHRDTPRQAPGNGAGSEGLTTPSTASLPMTPHATGEKLKTGLHATGENLMTALDRATIGNHRAIAAAHRASAAAIATRSAPSLPKREQRRRKLRLPNPTAHSLGSLKSRYTF